MSRITDAAKDTVIKLTGCKASSVAFAGVVTVNCRILLGESTFSMMHHADTDEEPEALRRVIKVEP